MPILNKSRLRTSFEEFENYLGEEMNAFSGFFMEELMEGLMEESQTEKIPETSVSEVLEKDESPPAVKRFWIRLKSLF